MRLILLLIIPLTTYSQEDLNNLYDYKHEIIWNSNFSYESNLLSTQEIYNLFDGNKLTDTEKNSIIDLEYNNNLFLDLTNSISYKNLKYNFEINISDNNFLNSNLSDDFLKLLLKGNEDYQNDTLDLSNTSIRANRYQQYKIKYNFINKNYSINTGISYLSGNYNTTLIINEGYLFTQPLGQQLNLDYNILANITDTNKINTFRNNGHGICLDLNINIQIKNYILELYVQDLGFIKWNKNDINYIADSTILFNGLETNNIFEINDSIIDYNIEDYADNISSKFKSYIPAKLGFSITHNLNNNIFQLIRYGINLRWQPYEDNQQISLSKLKQGINESNYTPLLWLTGTKTNKHLDIHPSISYGGYNSDINVGLAISRGKKNKLILGTQHLEDLLEWDNTNELNFYISISKKI